MRKLDYSIILRDSKNRVVRLSIIGSSWEEYIRLGYSEADAEEGLESAAFWNAVERGLIGDDAWLEARTI